MKLNLRELIQFKKSANVDWKEKIALLFRSIITQNFMEHIVSTLEKKIIQ
jgi:hypothetical protein